MSAVDKTKITTQMNGLTSIAPWLTAPAALILGLAAGLLLLLDRLHVSYDAATFGLSLLIAAYILAGLATERRLAIKAHMTKLM